MTYAQETVRTLYKKLLALYPRAFMERLGESMQQTFNDLYTERQIEGGWFGFMLWMFVETGMGIVREHMLLITEGDTMKTMLATPRSAALISFILCILCLPAAISLSLDVIGVDQNFWLLKPLFVVALLLLPVALAVSGAPIRLPAIIGFLIVLPFMILEFMFQIVNKPNALNLYNLTGLTVLFGVMWLLPTLFIAILIPMVRSARAGNSIMANPVFLLLRVVFLVIIVWDWGALVIDQLPCFMGVLHCD